MKSASKDRAGGRDGRWREPGCRKGASTDFALADYSVAGVNRMPRRGQTSNGERPAETPRFNCSADQQALRRTAVCLMGRPRHGTVGSLSVSSATASSLMTRLRLNASRFGVTAERATSTGENVVPGRGRSIQMNYSSFGRLQRNGVSVARFARLWPADPVRRWDRTTRTQAPVGSCCNPAGADRSPERVVSDRRIRREKRLATRVAALAACAAVAFGRR